MKKIQIEKTVGADTRSAREPVSKETLLRESHLHKSHVRKLLASVASELIEKGEQHDHTKISLIDQFHDNFVKAFSKEIEFKDHPWWAEHLNERHHINDFMHDDTDLLDLIEMIADCVCAGMARTGKVFPIEISSDKLQRIVQNTANRFIAAIEVKDSPSEAGKDSS